MRCQIFFFKEEVSAVGESSFFVSGLEVRQVGGVGFLIGKDERVVAASDGTGGDW